MDDIESELADFITERIEKTGGSAQIQYLVGFLKNLNNSVANNQGELMKFLRKHPDLFTIDANANVKLKTSASTSFRKKKVQENGAELSHERTINSSLPEKIVDGQGIVTKVHPTFGFILYKSNIKTTIYFTPSCFSDKTKTLFTDFEDLTIGKAICFNAIKGIGDHFSKYRATRVWFPKVDKEKDSKVIFKPPEPNPRKSRDTGLYDPIVNEGEGKIFKLFPNYGFIAVDGDTNNTVFFYKNQLSNFENVVDLTKALKIGSRVAFKAMRTPKKNIKARWSATQVWIIKAGNIDTNSKKASKDEASERQYLKNETGKIFPHSKGAVIKFGQRFEKLADADSSLFYVLGARVEDVSWEFSDGDNVHFDAIQIKSHPGWKASLVWTGPKPNNVFLPTDFDDLIGDADNFPDSVSYISKSSNNSTMSESTSKSSQNSKRESSGYSSKVSHDNLNHSRRQYSRSSYNKNHSHRESEIDMSDTASCTSAISSNASVDTNRQSSRNLKNQKPFNKKFPDKKTRSSSVGKHLKSEKGRFQRHLEFVSSTFKGSSDSIVEDNKSVRSESSKEKLTFLGLPEEKSYKNWGDSPYPDDIPSDTEDEDSLNAGAPDLLKAASPVQSEKSVNCSELSKSPSIEVCDNEIYNSEDEFSDSMTEPNELPSSNLKPLLFEKGKYDDLSIESSGKQPEKKASIKIFHDIEGTVKKVHCKYAEIESNRLSKTASFFFSDLYSEGTPIPELDYDDLREVIKVEDFLKFNCIEVIDDEGKCFIKVTVVWMGKKPVLEEITPEEFISQNSLSVTLTKDSYQDFSEKENLSSSNLPEVAVEEPPIRKFLTVAYSDLDDGRKEDSYDSAPTVEERDIDNNSLYGELLHSTEVAEGNNNESNLSLDRTLLIDGVSKIIQLKGLSSNSQMDLDIISSEIVDFVLRSSALLKSQSPVENVAQSERDNEAEISQVVSTLSVDMHVEKKKIEVTDTESQTIFTGEVIGKSIFTQC